MAHEGITYACIYLEGEREGGREKERERGRKREKEGEREVVYFHVISALLNTDLTAVIS